MDKRTQKYIGILVVLIIVLLVLALYGWLSGSWEPASEPNKEGMWHDYQNPLFPS